MFLFIFESIGTSELLMIGVVALIFLGPRRMPEMARKFGKFMSEFRGTANEFKDTWRREVDFESAAKEFDLSNLEAEIEASKPIAKRAAPLQPSIAEIKEIDVSKFEELKAAAVEQAESKAAAAASANDKKNWL
ncbi:MAG TPA: Sec-independent protein translocase protein TatB [Pyrinomonadaceae bacterium]|nr:Sec-independent protein translocase protein TatB [Pyrinomonadaceae bacterium]